MHFAPSLPQRGFMTALRQFLTAHATEADVRRSMTTDAGFDSDVWVRACAELNLGAVGIPVGRGGAGGDFVDQVLVQEELGRALYGGPFLSSTILGGAALVASPDRSATDIVGEVAAGRVVVTLAATRPGGTFTLADVGVNARPDGHRWLLTGSASYVFHGALADHVIVLAHAGVATALYLVSAGASGTARTPLPTLDLTRRQAEITFAGTPAVLLGEAPGDQSTADAQRVLDLAQVAIAAEQVGGADQCLALTIDYTREREQFGRPVGAFQALQHRCAEVAQKIEAARSAVRFAAWVAEHSRDELGPAAALAKMLGSETYLLAAETLMQFQGGRGFTWDSPAHLYLKRAKSTALLHGMPTALRRQLGETLLDRV